MAPRKSKVTAVPVDAPASESASAEPNTDAQAMSEVISEIKAEPVVEAEPVPEPVVSKPWRQPRKKAVEPVPEPEPVEESSASEQADEPKGMLHPGAAVREKVVCDNCGKSMTAKTLKYSHVHNCKRTPEVEKKLLLNPNTKRWAKERCKVRFTDEWRVPEKPKQS